MDDLKLEYIEAGSTLHLDFLGRRSFAIIFLECPSWQAYQSLHVGTFMHMAVFVLTNLGTYTKDNICNLKKFLDFTIRI